MRWHLAYLLETCSCTSESSGSPFLHCVHMLVFSLTLCCDRFQYARPEAVRHQEELDDSHYRPEPVAGHFRHGSGSNTPRYDSGLAAATSRMNISTPSPKPHQYHQEAVPSSRRLFGRKKDSSRQMQESSSSSSQTSSFEITLQDSSHLSDWSKDGFKPMFNLSLEEDKSRRQTAITALCLSEAGFLAVAWETKLAILDLRGPEVLYSEGDGRGNEDITLLTWTICAEGTGESMHDCVCLHLDLCRAPLQIRNDILVFLQRINRA